MKLTPVVVGFDRVAFHIALTTPGLDFINILGVVFMSTDPKSIKNWQVDCIF
jgi:hypothetical protein